MSYKPSELEGQSEIEHSCIRDWPWHDFFDWVNHPTLRACNSLYMQDYFKQFFVLRSLEMIFSFLIKKSRLKAIEIEIAFFILLGIPRVARWIISFTLHISVITSPTNWYLYQLVSWNISEVINKNSTSAFNYWDDFSPLGHLRTRNFLYLFHVCTVDAQNQ